MKESELKSLWKNQYYLITGFKRTFLYEWVQVIKSETTLHKAKCSRTVVGQKPVRCLNNLLK